MKFNPTRFPSKTHKTAFMFVCGAVLACPMAQAENIVTPSKPAFFVPFSMETGSFSVPAPDGKQTMQEFDVGQEAKQKVTFSGTWTPTSKDDDGVLYFRTDADGETGYVLKISSKSMIMYRNDRGPLNTNGKLLKMLASQPYSCGPKMPACFKLIEDGSTFTVMDSDTNQRIMSVQDSTTAQGTTFLVGSNSAGSGTWSFKVDQKCEQSLPALGTAAIVVANFDQDNTKALNPKHEGTVVNRFGIPHSNCTLDIDFAVMTQKFANGTLGNVTVHRNPNPSGPQIRPSNYNIFLANDKITIVKEVDGQATLSTSAPYSIAKGSPFQMRIVVKDNGTNGCTITVEDRGQGNAQVVTLTDRDAPWLSGYQFGVYTFMGVHVCWNNIRMVLQ